MQAKAKVDQLWEQFRQQIDAAYEHANKVNDQDGQCLLDYATDKRMVDAMAALLGRECAHERRHRGTRRYTFPVTQSSKLILMGQASYGASLSRMPKATLFLTARDTAAEAEVLGWLARGFLVEDWRKEVAGLDYAKLVNA
jgi:hypothetical protein